MKRLHWILTTAITALTGVRVISPSRRLSLSAVAIVGAALLWTLVLGPSGRAIAVVGDHPNSETPGSKQAVIFSPFGPISPDDKASMDYFKAKVQAHAYVVTEYLDSTEAADDNPEGATASNFLNLSQKGLVYIVSHGGTQGFNKLLVEGYNTKASRDTAYSGYTEGANPTFTVDELRKCDNFKDHATPKNRIYGICITEAGVKNRFKDKDSIVHVAACYSFNFKEEFDAREYLGYIRASRCDQIKADTELLWGRMHGEKDGGKKRAAKVAYDAGGFQDIFKHLHKADKLDTVLSPAVQRHVPVNGAIYIVPTVVDGTVIFDTRMDTTVAPAAVLELVGMTPTGNCGAQVLNATWASPYILDFALKLDGPPGGVIMKVKAANARAERDFKNNLDGGKEWDPASTIHVGPNNDDHEWMVVCQAP